MNSEWLFSVLALLLVPLCAGCGSGSEENAPERAAVSGSVSVDGKPLPQGVVRFVPIDGTPGPKTSIVVEQGQFQADAEQGPVIGTHRIEIQSTDNGGYAMDDEDAIRRLRESGVKRIEAIRIPPQYNTRSTLKETVAAEGPNEFRFEVQLRRRR